MANPSTQPPSNAKTTNIIFGRDFVQSSYALLELHKDLEEFIKSSNDGQLSFQVRGLENDTAVLCTPTQTFGLQRAHTSNMLIPIAPILNQGISNLEQDPNTSADMEIDGNLSSYQNPFQISEDSQYESQAALDILDSVLNLIPISPRLDRLAELLGQRPFEGWAMESQQKIPRCVAQVNEVSLAI
ncbi:hypothetical protein BGZ76_004867 [Entomortierella beljakovae]|nr:hypothetical protein BGZ76_004867 [Entomortierella beljakovae]